MNRTRRSNRLRPRVRRRWLFEQLELRQLLASDFGDLPDLGPGTGPGNYETLTANNGPSHVIDATANTLFIGSRVDSEADGISSQLANRDDRFTAPGRDDEDGWHAVTPEYQLTIGSTPQVDLRVTNLTGNAATLFGWIDVNRDGLFDSLAERASALVPTGTNNGTVRLIFPLLHPSTLPGQTYARFRLSTDLAAAAPNGVAADGEVEDYAVELVKFTLPVGNTSLHRELAHLTNNGPSLADSDAYSTSVAAIGDVDGDGIIDVAVGAPFDGTGGLFQGAVYVQLMNSNGSVRASVELASNTNGFPTLVNSGSTRLGSSVAPLGDFDGDGIPDIALGAIGESATTTLSGGIHLVMLNANGTAKSTLRIAHGLNGGPSLATSDEFGSSIALLGDIDSDGVVDLAVGASRDDTGATDSGATYILRMNADGTVKASTKIASGINGGPTLAFSHRFGTALSAYPDIDQDGIAELLVGAPGDGIGAQVNSGAVYLVRLNATGSVKGFTKYANGMNGTPTLASGGRFGSSVSAIGDLDANGTTDLVVGAPRISNVGVVHLLLMNSDGTVRAGSQLGNALNGGPTLFTFDDFGMAATGLGDINGDGSLDIAVGTPGDDTGGISRGAVHVLFLNQDSTPPQVLAFDRVAPASALTNADSLTFRVTFSERVFNLDASDFIVTGTTATIQTITPLNDTQFELVIAGGNLANFNGNVGLNVSPTTDLVDLSNRPLSLIEPSIDRTYTLDNIAPTLLSIQRQTPLEETTSAAAVCFRLTFDEAIQAIDTSDLVVTGTSATTVMIPVSDRVFDIVLSGGDLPTLTGTVGIDLSPTQNISDLAGNLVPSIEPPIDEAYIFYVSTLDWGDAPDAGPGTQTNNYATRSFDNGPRHTIVPGLRLGMSIDDENDGSTSDDGPVVPPHVDDEDGLIDALLVPGGLTTVTMRATNLTSSPATLYGWLDLNRDGVFENATERSSIQVPIGSNNLDFILTFGTLLASTPLGGMYARFRLSSDPASADSIGAAFDGEVEDHPLFVRKLTEGGADTNLNSKIASGFGNGPTLQNTDRYGSALTNIGDIDADGIDDLVIGAPGDDLGGSDRGAIYVTRMLSDGTSKSNTRIASGLNGGPSLSAGDAFGSSIAAIGDLDGDGVVDLAVGASGDDSGGADRGAVHLLLMDSSGTVKQSIKLSSLSQGAPILNNGDAFGTSVAGIGDFDGDGVPDLAVGAPLDDTGVNAGGAIHLLMLRSDGSIKNRYKIASGIGGLSTLVNNDQFGFSVAGLGDHDRDGVLDIVAGARFDDSSGTDSGTVYTLFMNADGTVKSAVKIAGNLNSGPNFGLFDSFGSAVSVVGDIDGDGITDIAVGTPDDFSTGVVYLLRLNLNGTAKSSTRIAYNENGGPGSLQFYDDFGAAVTLLRDINSDGVIELAVGAPGDVAGADRGALHTLFLKPDTTPPLPSIRRLQPSTSPTNADSLVFRLSFPEDAINVDASDFFVTGTTATITQIVPSVSHGFDITVAGGDLATFNGTVGLNIRPTHNIRDRSGNMMSTAEPSTDETYTVDNLQPNFLSVVRGVPLINPTSANAIRFRIAFSEAVVNFDASDLIFTGTTATPTINSTGTFTYDITLTGGDLAELNGVVGIDLNPSHNLTDAAGNVVPLVEPAVDETYTLQQSPLDFGDAPDTGVGIGTGDYRTLLNDDGARHTVVPGLRLGKHIDTEPNGVPNDDGPNLLPDSDDEDALFDPVQQLSLTIGSIPSLLVDVINTTGIAATLYGWIDYNRDGHFDNATEFSAVAVPSSTPEGTASLTFPLIPPTLTAGRTYARFRLSTDPAASLPYGLASDGEVEDYPVVLQNISTGVADPAKNRKLGNSTNGVPLLVNSDRFGSSVASLGYFDGDAIPDMVVGRPGYEVNGSSLNTGAVHVFLPNADGSIRTSTLIASLTNNGPSLVAGDEFGTSVAAIGDLDGDGVEDLAVGAPGDDSSSTDGGAIHILYLRATRTVRNRAKLASFGSTGSPILAGSRFGSSVASIGDIDGDGIQDIAVGASRDSTGGTDRGALFLVMLNSNGSAKSSVKIAHATQGGPNLVNGDRFGQSVTALGDLDGNGVIDLAVGAPDDDTGGTGRGAVHILFLNPNGSVLAKTKIASSLGGGPSLANGDAFGSSISRAGDLDGDSVPDLLVGSPLENAVSTNLTDTGAVHVLFMNRDGTVKASHRLANNQNGSPTNTPNVQFGSAVSPIGDLDGDGRTEFAVGAAWDDLGGLDRGALHVLFTRADTIPPVLQSFTRQSPASNPTNAESLLIRATFNEDVIQLTPSDFVVSGGSTALVTGVTTVNPRTYDIKITGGNLASYHGTVGLNLAPGHTITDRSNNPISGLEPSVDQVFTLDNLGPILQSVTRLVPLNHPSSASGVRFLATFDEPFLLLDPSDFVPIGTTASLSVQVVSPTSVEVSLAGGDLGTVPSTVGIALAPASDITDTLGNPVQAIVPAINETFTIVLSGLDFGDAADPSTGTGPNNYRTRSSDFGPSHNIFSGLHLGARVDDEPDGQLSDDGPNVAPDADDEDGILTSDFDLQWTIGTAPRVRLSATNATSQAAMLYGWIDYDRNGDFDNASERAQVIVPANSLNDIFTLVFPVVPYSTTAGPIVSRFRLSTDAAAANSFGPASDGEVEDHQGVIIQPADPVVDEATLLKTAIGLNGFPASPVTSELGEAIANIGDLDGNGVPDLAFGEPKNGTGGSGRGAIHIAFMQANGTVLSRTLIASSTNGGPNLTDSELFGSAIAPIGDIDHDGVIDLAVGAPGDSTSGGPIGGSIYVLRMHASGSVKQSTRIGSNVEGGPTLPSLALFGQSIASLGDFDADGIPDLVVAAPGEAGTTANDGAAYVLLLNSDGTVRSHLRLARNTHGIPDLPSGSRFGTAVASLGDLNHDGITDIAISSMTDTGATLAQGVVHIVMLNADGTAQATTKIGHQTNGGPSLSNFDEFGHALASPGDIDGDGHQDLLVGAPMTDIVDADRGAVYFLPLNADGTAKSATRLAPSSTNVPALLAGDRFGVSLTSLGDRNGDGAIEIAVGAIGEDLGGVGTTDRGSIHTFALKVQPPEILDRRIFYHRSTSTIFGNGSGNPLAAIDSSKIALLPGETTNTAHYTNYTRGLNGLVIDVTAASPLISASDFAFATWNGIDASNFVPSSAVATISVIDGGGNLRSDRIKIEFPDNAIQNTWLRVTMLATPQTGLRVPDVFYFGNAIGDVLAGNIGSPTVVRVNATDTSTIRQNQSPGLNSVPITNPYDLNKDGRVNATDTSLSRQSTSPSLLRYFTAPASLGWASEGDASSAGPAIPGTMSLSLPALEEEPSAERFAMLGGLAVPLRVLFERRLESSMVAGHSPLPPGPIVDLPAVDRLFVEYGRTSTNHPAKRKPLATREAWFEVF